MRTLRGAPRGDDDLKALHKKIDDNFDLLGRRIARLPKPAQAGAVSMGTRRAYGSASNNTAGATTVVEAASWTFETGYDGADATLEPTLSVAADPTHLSVADAGRYFIRWRHLVEFTGAGADAVQMKLEHDNGYVPYIWTPAVLPGGSSILAGPGFYFDETIATFLEAGETFFPHIQFDAGSDLGGQQFVIEVTSIF